METKNIMSPPSLLDLPDDIIILIFKHCISNNDNNSYLPINSYLLNNYFNINKRIRAIAFSIKSISLWSMMINRDFHYPHSKLIPSLELYKCRYIDKYINYSTRRPCKLTEDILCGKEYLAPEPLINILNMKRNVNCSRHIIYMPINFIQRFYILFHEYYYDNSNNHILNIKDVTTSALQNQEILRGIDSTNTWYGFLHKISIVMMEAQKILTKNSSASLNAKDNVNHIVNEFVAYVNNEFAELGINLLRI